MIVGKVLKAQYQFSQAKVSPFNILSHFKTLKSFIASPRKHLKKELVTDFGSYRGPYINLTAEAFDEVAHQWYAVYTQHPFYLQVYNNLDNVQTVQFGTVDNPVAIFTADAPYRYVGCTGLQNEDDYEQHELMMFMLREGPLQRCPMCGQVFKLIRLRHEWTEEMEFYRSSFHPIDPTELALVDNIQMMNIFKMNTHNEPSQMEDTLIDQVYSPVNADEHARILVDPAYRLWDQNLMRNKYAVYNNAIRDVEMSLDASRPKLKLSVQKRIYETCIEAEKAWEIFDRHRKKVQRFHARELIDFENHQRREVRMKDRAIGRWDNHYSYFFGGLTEEEQKYRDYYETDQEMDPQDEMIEQIINELSLLQEGGYSPKKFDFQEYYSNSPEDDQTSLLEKKLFRFKYRAAEDSISDFKSKSLRMIQRQSKRLMEDPTRQKIFEDLQLAHQESDPLQLAIAEKNYYAMAAEEAFLLYKDYYEGDSTAEIELIEALFKANPQKFIPIYKNYVSRSVESDGYVKIPKRQWDESLSLFNNYKLDIGQYIQTIIPTGTQLANQAKFSEILPEAEQILLARGINEARVKAEQQIEDKSVKLSRSQQKKQRIANKE